MDRMTKTNMKTNRGRSFWLDALLIAVALFGLSVPVVRADFNYADFSSVTGLALNGDAAQAGSVLRVAPDAEGEWGSAWYTSSKAHVADGFDTTFTYQMNGSSGSSGADGLAFVIQDESTAALGNSGSGLGFEGITRSLAVEFDTFGFTPETDNHISVQSLGNNGNSVQDADSLAQVQANYDLNDGSPHTVLIRYRPGTLLVYVDDLATPVLVVAVDLQNINGDDILDGSGDAWVGFTAASGGLTQDHDILDWDFDETTDPLPTGACCTAGGCLTLTAQQCAAQGFYAGDDSDCGFAACTGACCTEGNCEEDVFVSDCATGGGTFLGLDVLCDFDSCQGACCDAFGSCYITDETDCTNNGGTFHGAGTSCTPFPCTLPEYGACCIDFECLMRTESECATEEGIWFGRGTSCTGGSLSARGGDCFGSPGPFGACCQPGGTCVDGVEQGACEYFNGVYNGDDSLCSESNCAGECDCENATEIFADSYFPDSTVAAPVCAGAPCSDASPAKIYSYTPTQGGWALINTCGFSDFDTVISVHTGCPMTAANEFACDHDSCGDANAQVYFCAHEGQTYYIRVGGEGGASGNYQLLVILFPGDVYEGPFQYPGNGHWYYQTNVAPWTGLEQFALTKGGHLATVNDAGENEWLRSMFAPNVGDIPMAIGYNDAAVEGTFEWVSGEPVTFINWQSGSPDNLGDQDYAVLNNAGEWEDFDDCAAGSYRGIIEVTTVPLPGILAGPIRNPGNCHDYYFTQPATWIEAQLKAESLGGDLVTIDDAAENEWVRANFANYASQQQPIWIGLADRTTEGVFAWEDGTPVGYTNWSAGEPNNLGNEDYGTMNDAVTGGWNDAHSGIQMSGLIEIPTPHCPCQCPLGDLNCDDDVTTADIPHFVQALLQTGFVGCDINLADMNSDTFIDGRDTQGFVNALLAP